MFLTECVLRVGIDTDEWILDEDLVYETDVGEIIRVPAGFNTDLASIPRALHAVIPLNGKHRKAAVVHDYLYVTQKKTREASDAIFLEAMRTSGVRYTQRYVMYWGVRIGGWAPWRARKNG